MASFSGSIRSSEEFNYLLNLLQRIDFDKSESFIQTLTDEIRRLGYSDEIVEKLLTDIGYRHNAIDVMESINATTNLLNGRSTDRVDIKHAIPIDKSKFKSRSSEPKISLKTGLPSKNQPSIFGGRSRLSAPLSESNFRSSLSSLSQLNKKLSNYSTMLNRNFAPTTSHGDAQDIALTEEYYELPITGDVNMLLSNYLAKYARQFPLKKIHHGGSLLLARAIGDQNLPQIRRLIDLDVEPPISPIFYENIIRKHGLTTEVLEIFNELLNMKNLGRRYKLIRTLSLIALRQNSSELLNFLQQHGLELRDLVKISVLAENMEVLGQAIEAGGDPDDAVVTAVKFKQFDVLKYLLDNGADPVVALLQAGRFWKNNSYVMEIVKYIDPDIVFAPAFIDSLRDENVLNTKLLDFTDKLVFQEPFPAKLITKLVDGGIKIEIKTALKMKNDNYIKKLLELDPVSIDPYRAIQLANKYRPELIGLFIPLLPELNKEQQSSVLRIVGRTHDSALLDLLLQNPNNDFAASFPRKLAYYQSKVVV